MQRMLSILSLGLAMAASNVAIADDDMHMYEVTVTNGSTAHVLTPPAIIAHNSKFSVFMVGQAASEQLATQAETGNPAPLLHSASESRGVKGTAAGGGVILPGHSATISIEVKGKRPMFTVTSMLASTNDAFIAVKNMRMHGGKHSKNALVYDAGSEANNESCHYIPGPPCGNPDQMRDTENAEGFVSFHKGIKGIADLDANTYDWRGPIATVSIKRMY